MYLYVYFLMFLNLFSWNHRMPVGNPRAEGAGQRRVRPFI